MKLSRIAAGGAGLALIAASTFVGATAASADDFYVTTLGTEGASYPAGWFTGTLSDPSEAGATVFGAGGLAITGKVQLLNGTVPTQVLTDLADDLDIWSTNSDFALQIPIFTDGVADSGFTTLVNTGSGWASSRIIPGVTTTTFESVDLSVLESTFGDLEILAYGALFDNGAEDTVIAIWDGVNQHIFTPQPVISTTPNPVTPADFKAAGKGVTVTVTGQLPGDTIWAAIVAPNEEDYVEVEAEVDATGKATFNFVWTGPAPVEGTYIVYIDGSVKYLTSSLEVKNVLPATGLDSTSTLLLGGILLAAGAGIALVTIRRKAAQA